MGFVGLAGGEIAILGQPVNAALKKNIVAYVPQSEDIDWNFPVLVEDVVMRRFVGEPGFRQRPLRPHDALGNGRLRLQEGARDLFRGQAADHPKRQRGAGLARQSRMAGGEDQPQQFVADVVVERSIRIGHRLLLQLVLAHQHLVLAGEHAPCCPE